MNNFDQSSTGLNITVSAFRDTDLSRFYFEEAFFTIKEGNKDLLVYSEGNYSDFEKEYSFTKAELLGAMIDELCWTSYGLDDLKKDIKEYIGSNWSKIKKDDLIDYMQANWGTAQWCAFCEKAGFKSNFDIVVSRGYCQGDYSEVIVPHKFWDIVGIPKPLDVQSNLGNYIDNLLWDCPIYCRFEVNGEEFYIDQELKNSYEWDKSEALEIAKRLISDRYRIVNYSYVFGEHEQEYIVNFLAAALKTNLDYQ